MNLTNYYWYFENVIPHKICDEIVQYGKMLKEKEMLALTGGYGTNRDLNKQPLTKKEIKDLKKKRNSNIVWMDDKWIYKEIQPYVHIANKNANWNFEWDFSENCQFTIYKKGMHYDWHTDAFEEPFMDHKNPFINGKTRKISLSMLLNESTEYKGGEFEFDSGNRREQVKTCYELENAGDLVLNQIEVMITDELNKVETDLRVNTNLTIEIL